MYQEDAIMRAHSWAVGLVMSSLVVGCGQKSATPAVGEAKPSPTLSIANSTPEAPPRPNLQQPFSEAVIEDCPGNQQPPPDRTMAGLSTGKLRLDVQKLWDS